ncbi:hypothetical protein NEFER03_1797 [Nematocida sp. LUAm3]|nr:hypothetical protein NEFER03_1797 [Nematocida sp. LUAm3]KAI5177359.1 hypothetical protein NEFER01_0634 [Nematocida sp. LUAm1]
MTQWKHKDKIKNPKGKSLFISLDLLIEENNEYLLKYPYNATYCALLFISTEAMYSKYSLSHGNSLILEKESIKVLHSYNQAKDASQEILGALARSTNLSIKEVQDKYYNTLIVPHKD